MTQTQTKAASQQVARIRPGLLDRLKAQAGIKSDDAFARLVDTSRATLVNLKNGDQPSLKTTVRIAQAFGLGIGEVIEMIPPAEAAEQREREPALAKAA